MTERDYQKYRREFWHAKRVQGLETELHDARRRGDPLAVYRLYAELQEFRDLEISR
jgi:hypothetical protein